MADYYAEFSTMLEITKEQKEFLTKYLEDCAIGDDDDSDSANTALDCLTDEKEGLWVHNDTELPDALLTGLQTLLAHFPDMKPISFEVAQTCSKPRVDSFGGLAIRITAQEITVKSTSDLLWEWTAGNETK